MIKQHIIGAATALGIVGAALGAVPAEAQAGRHRSTQNEHRDDRSKHARMHYYGANYGYTGYHGRWRTGQRYPNYNQSRYVVSNYRAYGLPAPRQGYRYYRDNNGDVVMAAIATGVIGLIIGGALNN